MTSTKQLFISYGHDDASEFAAELSQWLRSHGYVPWLDVENGIPIGSPFDIRIEQGIIGSDLLIAVLSPWSLRPEGFCRNELLFAQAQKVPIIPVRIADVVPPIQIISLNYLDVANDPQKAFDQLPSLLRSFSETGGIGRREWPTIEQGGPWWSTLPQLDFEEELARHGGGFVGREWLFEKIRSWVAQPEARTLLITADAGVGKSAIAAQLTARLNVKGVHFCSRSNPESCRPPAWIGSLVRQLSAQLPPFRQNVDSLLPQDLSDPLSILRAAIADPLRKCSKDLDIDEPWVFVVDGLDEAKAVAGLDLAEILADPDVSLPDWVRLIVTCRPDNDLLAMFRIDGVRRGHIQAEDTENLEDLEKYVHQRVAHAPEEVAAEPKFDMVADQVSHLAGGNFLFAKMTLNALFASDPEERLSCQEVGSLPSALGGLYHAMFRKRFQDLDNYEENLLPILECLIVAPQGTLPKDVLLSACGLDSRVAQKSIRSLSQFLQDRDSGISLFHKSVADWLSDDTKSGKFGTSSSRGHELLGDHCWREYLSGVDDMSPFCVENIAFHLNEAERKDDLLTLSNDHSFRHRFYEFWMPVVAEGLSPSIHGNYLDQISKVRFGKGDAFVHSFDNLSDEFKWGITAQARRIPGLLLQIGIYVYRTNLGTPSKGSEISPFELSQALESSLNNLAPAEHGGWVRYKKSQGWRLGPESDYEKKIHPDLVPYETLSERRKNRVKNTVRIIPEILGAAGYTIDREPPNLSDIP